MGVEFIKGEDEGRPLDIHDYLVKHPSSTFFMKMEGDGPEGSDIKAGDVLVVDRAVEANKGSIAIVIEGEELRVENISAKKSYKDSMLWGVVTGILRRLR